ncbi:PREDICTED: OX-2 membrane glycoprotein, partial [Fulmarus glacialis]|uniref:OX-2 membrane glycoprotein n=1 Tax=Fulmarus glacialis TaxID=30455 RepID=UPI00051AB215
MAGLKEAVKSDSVITAALGGEANFYCNFSLSMDVLQVTWQKINGSSFQNIATYSPKHGLRLIGSFQKKARFTRATLKASAITLQNLTFEDESYYRCIFSVFLHGSFNKDIYLNIQSVQKSIIITAIFIAVVFLIVLIYCIIRLINRKKKKLKRHSARRTPAEEQGLHQDLSEKAMSLHMPKDQHVVYENEEQTPGSSFHKRLPGLKRNLREKKNCRCSFSEEAENLNSNVHGVFERGPVGLCVRELGCTPMKEDREATA